jgi:hypothetical protein
MLQPRFTNVLIFSNNICQMSLCHVGIMVMVRMLDTTDPSTSRGGRNSNTGIDIHIWDMSGRSGMSDIVDIAPCPLADL